MASHFFIIRHKFVMNILDNSILLSQTYLSSLKLQTCKCRVGTQNLCTQEVRHFLLEVFHAGKQVFQSQKSWIGIQITSISARQMGLCTHHLTQPLMEGCTLSSTLQVRNGFWEALEHGLSLYSSKVHVFSITPRLLVNEQHYFRCLSRTSSYRSTLPLNVFHSLLAHFL